MRRATLILLAGCYSPSIHKPDAGGDAAGGDGPATIDGVGVPDGVASCPAGGVAFADLCFTPQTPIDLSSAPTDLDVRDFDGDSRFDPVVRVLNDVRAYTYAGIFTSAEIGAGAIEVGILEPVDSYDDVAVVDTANDQVTLLPGSPTAFGTALPLVVLDNPTLLAFGDLDGVTGDDLLVASPADVRPYLWSSKPATWVPGAFLNFVGADALAIGDYTFVAAGLGGLASWLRTSQAIFATADLTGQVDADGLVVGDLDRDGFDDVVHVVKAARDIRVLQGVTGTFAFVASYVVGPRPTALALADLDGDGNRDLVVVSHDNPRLTLLAGTGGLDFLPVSDLNVAGNPQGVAVADFDGDTIPDLAIATTQPPQLLIYRGGPR